MAKSKKYKSKKIKDRHNVASPDARTNSSTSKSGKSSRNWFVIALFGLAFLLYANTLRHDYTQDDAIVIYENMLTQQGVKGIPSILSNDTFYGFFKEEGKSKLVSGGRYRPFTQLMFAIEWQIFGKNPFIGHLVNIILYGLLGYLIYLCVQIILKGRKNSRLESSLFAFLVAAIFIAHPIHTEAVANIKGRDEIMALLGSMLAVWTSLKHHQTGKFKWIILTALSFFMALMSKENAITFLAVIPLIYFLFKNVTIGGSLKKLIPFVLSTVVFLFIRTAVLGLDFGEESMELMNNPFLKISNGQWVPLEGGEKLGTIMFTLGKYIQLLFFPHPLCHDYYPRAVEVMNFSDWQVIVSTVGYVALVALSIYFIKKDKLISFGILFFLITMSIISNIVFPIGTNMSERFMFMPSVGFAIIVVRLLDRFVDNKKLLYGIIGLIIVLFSAKTITRNTVWKDDFTLFTTDVRTNSRSAKLLNAAGGALTTTAAKLDDSPQKTKMLDEAIDYLNKAIEIHPTYKNAYLLLGNAQYYKNEYEQSINHFDKLLRLYPDFADAKRNLPIVLRDAGKHYGQIKNDLATSEKYLTRSYELNPKDGETVRLLGIVNGIKGNHEEALKYFMKGLEIKPDLASSYVNVATAYKNKGDAVKAAEYYNKALEIDPKALDELKSN